jgi:hypothetical protein
MGRQTVGQTTDGQPDRWIDELTDGQTEQTARWADHTDGQTDRWTKRERERKGRVTDGQTDGWTDGYTNVGIDRWADEQTDGWTDGKRGQTDRQAGRKIHNS